MATASARAEATATVPGSGTATQIPRDRFPFTLSDTMRAYIDSLPDKITVRQEVTSYRFWKSLRTELISTFLFVVFSQSVLEIVNELYKQQDPKPSALGMVATGLAVLAVITSLVQATGHVSGCHLTIAITVGLFTTERVSPVRLVSYVLIQLLGSMAGMAAVFGLFGHRPSPPHLPEGIAPNQVFGFEFLATYLVVLTYLGNCDERRKDLGFKSLSIGLGWLAAHLFAVSHLCAFRILPRLPSSPMFVFRPSSITLVLRSVPLACLPSPSSPTSGVYIGYVTFVGTLSWFSSIYINNPTLTEYNLIRSFGAHTHTHSLHN